MARRRRFADYPPEMQAQLIALRDEFGTDLYQPAAGVTGAVGCTECGGLVVDALAAKVLHAEWHVDQETAGAQEPTAPPAESGVVPLPDREVPLP